MFGFFPTDFDDKQDSFDHYFDHPTQVMQFYSCTSRPVSDW